MIATWLDKLVLVSRRLVVRVLLIACLAILAIGLAKVAGRLIPPGAEGIVGAGAVDHLLSILANSMLTVTTFSLTVMAATHRAVAGLWSPRAHQILLEDTTTHTVLATFVGAYLYAVIAIILRETEVFLGKELLILFAVTLLVMALVLIAVIRWILHLEMFGSLINTAQRIEQRTAAAWALRRARPSLGGRDAAGAEIPAEAVALRAATSAYVKLIYPERLQRAAEGADGRIWLVRDVGQFVYEGDELAFHSPGEGLAAAIRDGIELGSLRDYTQDPGFGLLTLSEMGSRAFSPGVNDPGTGIDALRRMVRVLLAGQGDGPEAPTCDRLWMPPLDTRAMVARALGPVIRDGAGRPEVEDAAREALSALARHSDRGVAAAAEDLRAELATADGS